MFWLQTSSAAKIIQESGRSRFPPADCAFCLRTSVGKTSGKLSAKSLCRWNFYANFATVRCDMCLYMSLKREPGENPGQSRCCKFYITFDRILSSLCVSIRISWEGAVAREQARIPAVPFCLFEGLRGRVRTRL